MILLALEVGTREVRAAVWDTEADRAVGQLVATPLTLDSPLADAAEIAADKLWQAISQTARTALRQIGTPDVAGIGLACFSPGLVLLDAKDQPLGPIWTPLDRRSRPTARRLNAAIGAEFLATTGNRPLAGIISAVCFRQRVTDDPYLLHDIRSYLHMNGWLAHHLTGEKAFDPAGASYSGLFNTLTDQKWSLRWCEFFEVDPAWLPRVIEANAVVGHIRPAIAAELGVPLGIPVKIGTSEPASAALAADLRPGELLHVSGSTELLVTLANEAIPSPRRLTCLAGTGSGFLHITYNPVGVAALDWVRRLCFLDQTETEFHEKTLLQARTRTTRACFDPPFLTGDFLEIETTRAAFRDLTLTNDRLDLLAALLAARERRHREAIDNLGLGSGFRRVVLEGSNAERMRALYENRQTDVAILSDGALRGATRP